MKNIIVSIEGTPTKVLTGLIAMFFSIVIGCLGFLLSCYFPNLIHSIYIGTDVKGSAAWETWHYITSLNEYLNYLLVGMFVFVYIPCALLGGLFSLTNVLLLLPYIMITALSMVAWPLMCPLAIVFIAYKVSIKIAQMITQRTSTHLQDA